MTNSRGKQATGLVHDLVKAPPGSPNSFLGFPLALDLDNLDADIAILGVPFGLPNVVGELANDQSRAPDAIRQNAQDAAWEEPRTRVHFDWDLWWASAGKPACEGRRLQQVRSGSLRHQAVVIVLEQQPGRMCQPKRVQVLRHVCSLRFVDRAGQTTRRG